MSFVKVMIHAVWGTKSHVPFLTNKVKPSVLKHIKENAVNKGIYIDALDGDSDHLHCLFGLPTDMSIAKALQLIKGESAFWINKEKITKHKFEWSDEYFAASVSESMLPKVRAYIRNQEQHHKKSSFTGEYEEFIEAYNFKSQG